ncbi:MAG: hypothetical protein SVV88_10995 [Pseudomonadota bacterium]|nr:hypothetical protein [Pseudomonadota bacterium]
MALSPGFWHSTFFAANFWPEDFWQDYGVALVVFTESINYSSPVTIAQSFNATITVSLSYNSVITISHTLPSKLG